MSFRELSDSNPNWLGFISRDLSGIPIDWSCADASDCFDLFKFHRDMLTSNTESYRVFQKFVGKTVEFAFIVDQEIEKARTALK